MGSPLSPVLANLFMEEFEKKFLATAPHPPKFWGRYVDDTGVVNKKEHEEELFQHINKQHPSIKFTIEKEENNTLPMLDVKMIRQDNSISTDVYRKPTHTDQYLLWTSHHPVHQKLGIVKTLMHRADTLIKDEELRKKEKDNIRKALRDCLYPEWALKKGEDLGKKEKKQNDKKDEVTKDKPVGFAVLPYIQGVTERLQRVYKKHNLSLYSKAGHTVRNVVVKPKDPLEKKEKCGVIYKSECSECGEVYIGETERSLGERAEEHETSLRLRDMKSALSQHLEKTGHTVMTKKVIDSVEVIDSESKTAHRKIKEAIHIRLQGAKLNRNQGVDLPDIYLPLLRGEVRGAERRT